jgi:hypothetical protein
MKRAVKRARFCEIYVKHVRKDQWQLTMSKREEPTIGQSVTIVLVVWEMACLDGQWQDIN